jgi:hypothetical protein
VAIGIFFDKAKAQHFLDALKHGKPIAPQDPLGWTNADILALAGACHFAAMSHGPALYKNTDFSKVPGERREAIEETLMSDLLGAIEWHSHATMLVCDGEYDKAFEPHHSAIIIRKDEERRIVPVKGFKQEAK